MSINNQAKAGKNDSEIYNKASLNEDHQQVTYIHSHRSRCVHAMGPKY